jgi:hypothetical protein
VDAEILGVHPVPDGPSCWLIELSVRGFHGPFDPGEITQDAWGKVRWQWQVAYDERVLDPAGKTTLPKPPFGPIGVAGELRLAFYFHELDLARPLRTPVGGLALPATTPIPARLSFMRYTPVD